MVTLEQKKQIVADLVGKFGDASGFYLVDFVGMTVEEAINFRRQLKKNGIVYKVAKNTLIKRALEETSKDGIIPNANFFGASGVVFAYDDAVAPARIIKELFDKSQKPRLKAAVIEGVFYDGSQLKTIAALPSKPDIISGIIGSLHSPISGIVGSINAVMRDVAYLVEEVAKKQAS
jgi:large subunit ribosomal protein L10